MYLLNPFAAAAQWNGLLAEAYRTATVMQIETSVAILESMHRGLNPLPAYSIHGNIVYPKGFTPERYAMHA